MKMSDESQDHEMRTKIFHHEHQHTQPTKDMDDQEPSKYGCFNWEVQL